MPNIVFEDLPVELQVYCFSSLDKNKDLKNVAQVCTKWRDMSKNIPMPEIKPILLNHYKDLDVRTRDVLKILNHHKGSDHFTDGYMCLAFSIVLCVIAGRMIALGGSDNLLPASMVFLMGILLLINAVLVIRSDIYARSICEDLNQYAPKYWLGKRTEWESPSVSETIKKLKNALEFVDIASESIKLSKTVEEEYKQPLSKNPNFWKNIAGKHDEFLYNQSVKTTEQSAHNALYNYFGYKK